jgi:hypothetical protein
LEQQSILSRWPWINIYSWTKYQQFYMGGCAKKTQIFHRSNEDIGTIDDAIKKMWKS